MSRKSKKELVSTVDPARFDLRDWGGSDSKVFSHYFMITANAVKAMKTLRSDSSNEESWNGFKSILERFSFKVTELITILKTVSVTERHNNYHLSVLD